MKYAYILGALVCVDCSQVYYKLYITSIHYDYTTV